MRVARHGSGSIGRMADPSVLVVARVHGLAVRALELQASLTRLADASREEDGCVSFDVLVEPSAGGELVTLSGWRDHDAMRAHFAGAAYGSYVDAVADLLARPSDVAIHVVAGTEHPVGDLSAEPRRAD